MLIPEIGGGFFEGVSGHENRPPTFRVPPPTKPFAYDSVPADGVR